jgi:hypothetical protein
MLKKSNQLTCSEAPKVQSDLRIGAERTKGIQRWPNLEKKESFSGISIGKHSGWISSFSINFPSGIQHGIVLPLAFLK